MKFNIVIYLFRSLFLRAHGTQEHDEEKEIESRPLMVKNVNSWARNLYLKFLDVPATFKRAARVTFYGRLIGCKINIPSWVFMCALKLQASANLLLHNSHPWGLLPVHEKRNKRADEKEELKSINEIKNDFVNDSETWRWSSIRLVVFIEYQLNYVIIKKFL